ncbi:MAG: hypothetical protein HYX21_02035 [Candidatus Yanofskybacteria bacterium]|nr:hypothetical protein [Candidatus Yanofskybacteria bacterium]
MNENLNEKIDEKPVILENVTKDVLDKLGYQAEVNIFSNEKDQNLKVVAINSSEDLSALIGKNGQNIKAVEHVIKLLYFKRSNFLNDNSASLKPFAFMVDINDYRKLRVQQVIEKALGVANRVKVTKKAEALDPMSSYERRLIHVELASHPDLETESIGEEPERRVVIRPLII